MPMDKFIYVFSAQSCRKLLDAGFHLLKSDDNNSIYVFENTADLKFSLKDDFEDDDFMFSNSLTF